MSLDHNKMFTLMFEANPTIRNPHDGTAFAIHCGLISGGLIPEGKVTCPPNWSSIDGFYNFRYMIPSSSEHIIAKMISMDAVLIVHVSKEAKDSPVYTAEFIVDDYFDCSQPDLRKRLRDLDGLAAQVHTRLLIKVFPQLPRPRVQPEVQEFVYPRPQNPHFGDHSNLGRRGGSTDPFNIGGGDLDPFRGGGAPSP